MAKPRKKNTYTDAQKKRAVARVMKRVDEGEDVSLIVEATELGIADSALRQWVRNPKFGGRPKAFTKGNKKKTVGIPQEKVKHDTRKPRRLVATKFGCPWCGGPIAKE